MSVCHIGYAEPPLGVGFIAITSKKTRQVIDIRSELDLKLFTTDKPSTNIMMSAPSVIQLPRSSFELLLPVNHDCLRLH